MRGFFGKSIRNFGRPLLRQDLQCAHVKVAVMKECLEPGHLPRHETPVLADAVATHRRRALVRPLGKKAERFSLSILHRDTALEYTRREARFAVLPGVPFVHGIHRGPGLPDGNDRAFGKLVQKFVGNDGGDLDNGIAHGIEPRHLEIDPDQIAAFVHGPSVQR